MRNVFLVLALFAPSAAPASGPPVHAAPSPTTRPRTAEDEQGPAGVRPSIAWGLANEFMRQRSFAAKYHEKGSEVSEVSADEFEVRFDPRDKSDPAVRVRVNVKNRECAVLEERQQ